MRRLQSHLIGIDEGDVTLFSDFEHQGPMWSDEGPRSCDVAVEFSEPFATPPSVHVALSMCDISHEATARMDIRADLITEKGFSIVFRTWGDTKIARARANWRAIGELGYDEDWQLY